MNRLPTEEELRSHIKAMKAAIASGSLDMGNKKMIEATLFQAQQALNIMLEA